MDASTATEPTAAARAANGDAPERNVGRIEEIQGVVIEAVFPDKLP
jgi:F-type H+-transporting ATPase subunit beta